MSTLYYPEGFISTTLTSDINASTTVIPLDDLPVRVTTGYLVIEPESSTKREVIFFTSVGASSVTAADDTTDGNDATGRGCLGSITVGANTSHDQGVAVVIASVEQYWKRLYDVFTEAHNTDGTHKSGSVLTLPQINDTSSDHQYIFAVNELAADRTVTLPLLTGNDEFVFKDHAVTMTNKTLTSPVINTPTLVLANSSPTADGSIGFDRTGEDLQIGDGTNSLFIHVGEWSAWTPTLTNITLGNGTVTARYAQLGKLIVARLNFVFGSSSSISGLMGFSLPVTAQGTTITSNSFPVTIIDQGTGTFEGVAKFGSSTRIDVASLLANETYVKHFNTSSTVPMTWAENDLLQFSFFYEAA